MPNFSGVLPSINDRMGLIPSRDSDFGLS